MVMEDKILKMKENLIEIEEEKEEIQIILKEIISKQKKVLIETRKK